MRKLWLPTEPDISISIPTGALIINNSKMTGPHHSKYYLTLSKGEIRLLSAEPGLSEKRFVISAEEILGLRTGDVLRSLRFYPQVSETEIYLP